MDVCRHYVETVNANIELFLEDKSRTMKFDLETAERDFRRFWSMIGAVGDQDAALKEWDRRYNASTKDSADSSPSTPLLRVPWRALKKSRSRGS